MPDCCEGFLLNMLDCCKGGIMLHMALHAHGAFYSLAAVTMQHACALSSHRQVESSFLGTT